MRMMGRTDRVMGGKVEGRVAQKGDNRSGRVCRDYLTVFEV